MSVGNSSSTKKVTSKYFSKSGMDESLSDFQEKKQFAAPNIAKPKPKTKKVLKRPRGQKDIRTALKPKKSELLVYSEVFDNVCKQSGIDVDPEQLQLAIALSKSVQPSSSDSNSSEPGSQERTARIRSTLQEYGFTVPEIKISNRRIKKQKKNYKLLLISETEKRQNIADKYSQVLLQNISQVCSPSKRNDICGSGSKLYFLATNVSYDTIKDNNKYYVENLSLEKSLHKGSLLRDWSEIPGRPVSPKQSEDLKMDVSEIMCSQEELNVILSGTMNSVKNVIKNKLKKSKDVEIIDIQKSCGNNSTSNHIIIEDHQLQDNKCVNNKFLPAQVTSETARSCSPDIFDDEPSCLGLEVTSKHDSLIVIEDNLASNKSVLLTSSIDTIVSSQNHVSQKWNITRRKSNDVMEMTECVGVTLNPSSYDTMKTDTTKRKSNDFMEITNCVTQQKINIVDNIDLTQNFNEKVTDEKDVKGVDCMDLTQSSNFNDTLHYVSADRNNKTLDETIILNESDIPAYNKSVGKEDDLIETTMLCKENNKILSDLTTETYSKKSVSVEDSSKDTLFEEFLYDHSHSPKQTDNSNEKSLSYSNCKDKIEIDLTQSPERSDDDTVEFKSEKQGNYEMDLTQSSSASEEDKIVNILANKVELCHDSSLGKKDDVSIDYDELSISYASSSMNRINVYDLSVDIDSNKIDNNLTNEYDVANSCDKHSNKSYTSQTSQEYQDFEISDKELNYSMHKSRYEDCYEVDFGCVSFIGGNSISNKNNSLQNDADLGDHYTSKNDSFLPEVYVKKKGFENIEPCNSGLSPIKNEAICHIVETPVKSPKDNLKNRETPIEAHAGVSPVRNINFKTSYSLPEHNFENHVKATNLNSELSPIKNNICSIIKTPSNNEYIIKTDQVTPMGDYAAMSTPDRNKELDKYGLKPIKRKRAIQLLTHIYNQTHPVVEPCTSQVSQSPTKRRKTEPTKQIPKKSPRKNLKAKSGENTDTNKNQVSPNKNRNFRTKDNSPSVDLNYEIQENIYEVTNERVEIRNIECADDEWVFQKREKAKVHSCRVPLHVAFHNYVSCRRGLREAILRYEPVEIDVIHKDLAANGYRYDPKDLLKFLDKKCITVKTADNNPKANRK